MSTSQPPKTRSSAKDTPKANIENYGSVSKLWGRSASGKAIVIISFTASMIAIVFALVTRKQFVAPLQKLIPRTTAVGATPNQTWPAGSQIAPSFVLPNQNGVLIHGPMSAKVPTLLVFITRSCNTTCTKTLSSIGSVETHNAVPIVIVSNRSYSNTNAQLGSISKELNLGSSATNWNWLTGPTSIRNPVVKNYSNIVAAGSLNGSVFVLGPKGHLRYFWSSINSPSVVTNAVANS